MARRSTPSALAATLAAGTVALLALTGCTATATIAPDAALASAVSQTANLPVPAVSAPPDAGVTPTPTPNVSVVPLPVVTPPPSTTTVHRVTVAKSVTEAAASYAQQLFALTNAARASASIAKLSWSSCAASAALGRAARALPKSTLVHEPLTFSCTHGWAGENLALDFGSPQTMFNKWMASAGHRENILRPEFTSVGVGCVAFSKSSTHRAATRTSDIGGYLCSQVFLG